MSCKSAIFTVNNSETTVTVTEGSTAQIPFGSVIRRFGKNLMLDGGAISCCESGYFDADISATLTPVATTAITLQLFQNGVAIPGAFATATPVAAGSPLVLPISALVRNCGCNCNSVLTLRVNASCTINNVATVIEKL